MITDSYPFMHEVEVLILVIWAITMLIITAVHYIVIRRERKMIQMAELNIADDLKDIEMVTDQFFKKLDDILSTFSKEESNPLENATLTEIANEL